MNGGINTYNYVGGNAVGKVDPKGLIVDGIFNTANNTLTITDRDTGEKLITTGAFTEGSTATGKLIYGGDSDQVPITKGWFYITDNVNDSSKKTALLY